MTAEEFYKELDSTLGLKGGTITGQESLSDLPGWDSLALLLFIDMAELKLGLIVKASELVKCKSVGDLVKVCEGKVTP
jgi:acyl carrier protein